MSDRLIGKEVVIKNASVAGIVSCVPPRVIQNEYFNSWFKSSEIEAVSQVTGVHSRRWVDSHTTTADLCFQASKRLLSNLEWSPDSIDCLIFVSQTPDYKLPSTSCVLQNRLDLPNECISFDLNLGCSGYPYALWLGMTLIQSKAVKRVLLAVGDTISKVIDPEDRSTAMLFGDAASVTAIEWTDDLKNTSYFIMGTDGKGSESLIIPQGGSRYAESNNLKPSSKYLFMDGPNVFNFTLKTVPLLIEQTMELSKKSLDDYDYILFHQANLFILNHFLKKMNISAAKSPINIDEYGNTSSASIPLLITTRIQHKLKEKNNYIAMFGFGVGFSWASACLSFNPNILLDCITYEPL